MFCWKCGAINDDDAKVCAKCGEPIDDYKEPYTAANAEQEEINFEKLLNENQSADEQVLAEEEPQAEEYVIEDNDAPMQKDTQYTYSDIKTEEDESPSRRSAGDIKRGNKIVLSVFGIIVLFTILVIWAVSANSIDSVQKKLNKAIESKNYSKVYSMMNIPRSEYVNKDAFIAYAESNGGDFLSGSKLVADGTKFLIFTDYKIETGSVLPKLTIKTYKGLDISVDNISVEQSNVTGQMADYVIPVILPGSHSVSAKGALISDYEATIDVREKNSSVTLKKYTFKPDAAKQLENQMQSVAGAIVAGAVNKTPWDQLGISITSDINAADDIRTSYQSMQKRMTGYRGGAVQSISIYTNNVTGEAVFNDYIGYEVEDHCYFTKTYTDVDYRTGASIMKSGSDDGTLTIEYALEDNNVVVRKLSSSSISY